MRHEWVDEAKPWAGLVNPCTRQDQEIFSAITKFTIGNGKKALFWGGILTPVASDLKMSCSFFTSPKE
jgi:hypothetical protein